ncbi:hypothetical protein [Paenibacillus dendritiformis]|uniref:hypothetical protein n=1 Tax=Paenibacillus dendritiformis TaxID=130049 RepID=UPI001F55936F|nr:hypothetical protein [Paenibacillus dendritiformis]
MLDREGRVIYVGSFSSTLLPHVRIGYAVLPPALTPLFARAKTLYEPHPSNLLEQRTLAAWMNFPPPVGGRDDAWRQSDAGHWTGDGGGGAMNLRISGSAAHKKACHGWLFMKQSSRYPEGLPPLVTGTDADKD